MKYQDVFMHGQNVMHLATEYSCECLEYLYSGPFPMIANHIVATTDYFGKTALHLAAANTTSDCAAKILFAIEDVKTLLPLQDAKGNTPLHIVCHQGISFPPKA